MEYIETVLQYGDIIKLFAPNNETFNNKTFMITYIDSNEIHISNLESRHILKLFESAFIDSTITNI